MIILDDILIADDIVKKQFVCDLNSCKGGCCVEGDAGAPLKDDELEKVREAFKLVKGEMTAEAVEEAERVGGYTADDDFTWVTPTVGDGICTYGVYDENGIVKCLIEKAYNEGRTDFKKPISCHLFPILQSKEEQPNGEKFEALNYEPRKKLCAPACAQGEKLKVPVYKFLKEPLIREYGEDWWKCLDAIAVEEF